MAHLGTGRSDAMCRNRYARLMAPHRPGVKCTNYCKLCGQLKRGHTCTNASGTLTCCRRRRAPPPRPWLAASCGRRRRAFLPVKLVEAGRASTISTEARAASRPPSARGPGLRRRRRAGRPRRRRPRRRRRVDRARGHDTNRLREGLVTKPQALDKALVEFGHQLSPRSLSSIVQRWRCLHRTQALMCPPEARLDAALPRACALRALFQRAETLAMATSPRPAAAQRHRRRWCRLPSLPSRTPPAPLHGQMHMMTSAAAASSAPPTPRRASTCN